MPDAMLQKDNCVAVLQGRLSYNGSIATSPHREGPEMRTRPTTRSPQDRAGQARPGFRRAGITVAGLVSLALLAGACGSSSPSASQVTTPTTAAGTSNTG